MATKGPWESYQQEDQGPWTKFQEVKPPEPVAPSTQRTTGEAFKDIAAGALTGLGGLLQFPGQVVKLVPGLTGVGEALETPGEYVAKAGEDLKSAGLKAREAIRSKALSDAEKDGVLSQFATAITSTITDPALLANFVAEQVPLLLGPAGAAKVVQKIGAKGVQAAGAGLAGEAAQAATIEAAKRLNTQAARAAIGTGAAMQAGDISSDTYQAAYQAALQQGLPEDQAKEKALNAARIAAVGAGGVSLATAGALSKLGGTAIERRLAGLPGAGRIPSALGEATSESLEEAGGQLFQNIALRQVDPNQSLTAGVGAAAGLGALGGGFFGGLLGKKPDIELAPGQQPGESLYDAAMRLNTQIQQLDALARQEETKEEAKPSVDLVEMYRTQGYGAVKQYQQQLAQMIRAEDAPIEQRKAAAVLVGEIQNFLNQVTAEEQARRTREAKPNVMTDTDVAVKLGIPRNDPLYKELVGKDLNIPEQAQTVTQALTDAMDRKGLRQTQRERFAAALTTINEYLEGIPGSGFYAQPSIEPAGGAGVGVAGVSGERPTTGEPEGAKRTGVVRPAEAVDRTAAGKGLQPITVDVMGQAPEGETVEQRYKRLRGRSARVTEALRDKYITQEQADEFNKALEEAQTQYQATLSESKELSEDAKEALKIADEMSALGVRGIPEGIRLAAERNQVTAPMLANYRQRLEQAKQIRIAPAPSGVGLDAIMTGDPNSVKRLVIVRQEGSKEDKDLLNQVDQAMKALAKEAQDLGYDINDPTAPPAVKSLKDKYSSLGGAADRFMLDRTAVIKQYKRSNEAKAQKSAQELQKLISAAPAKKSVRAETEKKAGEILKRKEEAPAPEVSEKEIAGAARAELVKQLNGILKRILAKYGLKDVQLNLDDAFKDEGSYSRQVITMALNLDNPVRVLRHESIHALKGMGFFTPQQWSVLEKRAKDEWIETLLKKKSYTDTQSRYDAYIGMFTDEAKAQGLSGKELDNYVETAIIEEAIADAFGEYEITPPPGMLGAIVRRMRNLFKAIKEAFGQAGIESAEEIFGKIEEGKLQPTLVEAATEVKPSLRAAEAPPSGVPANIWQMHTQLRIQDAQLSGELPTPTRADGTAQTAGVLEGIQKRLFRRYNAAVKALVGEDESLPFMQRLNTISSIQDAVREGDDQALETYKVSSPKEYAEVMGEKPSLRTKTDTPQFKSWFGQSKIVDKDGNPKVMYHGTARDIETFKPKQAKAIFFTEDPEIAENYAQESAMYMADRADEFLSEQQMDEALATAKSLLRANGYKPNQIAALQKDKGIFKTDEYREAVSKYMPSAPNIMPVYIKAEYPFDFDDKGQLQQVMRVLEDRKQAVKESDFKRTNNWTTVENENIQRAIRDLGFDGFYVNENGKKNLAVYNPNQIKTVFNSAPTEGPEVRRSLRSPIGLYSELENKIEAIPSKQAPASQWKTIIKALPQKGVKPEEIEWSGVNDWLDLQKGKVSKDDLLNYLRANGVQVEEVVLSEKADAFNKYLEARRASEEAGGNTDVDAISKMPKQMLIEEEEKLLEAWKRYAQTGPIAKYSSYVLPGGENYREVLLTLPSVDAETQRLLDQERYLVLTPEEQAKVDEAKKKAGVKYRSPHWDQPNVLAHIRVNDRTDGNGNKVLFVEEIQSDWGQQGKKKGFSSEKQIPPGWSLIQQNGVWVLSDADGEVSRGGTRDEAIAAAIKTGDIRKSDLTPGVPAAPFVTKTEGWLNLALKRIMVIAAEGGYDKVAFINGEQSADRYDLSKHITSLTVLKFDGGKGGYLLDFSTDQGAEPQLEAIDDTKLEEAVGKEMAQKIINNPKGRQVYRGLDLKVGGEGMKAFYDQIVPTTLRKLLPKVGGESMVDVNMPGERDTDPASGVDAMDYLGIPAAQQGRYWSRLSESERDKLMDDYRNRNVAGITQPGFDVTPAMQEKIATTGLPKFSLRTKPFNPDKLPKTNRDYILPQGTILYHGAYKSVADAIQSVGYLKSRPEIKAHGGLTNEGGLIWFGSEETARNYANSKADPMSVQADEEAGIVREPGRVFESIVDKPYRLINREKILSQSEADALNKALGLPDYKQLRKGNTVQNAANRADDYKASTIDRYEVKSGKYVDKISAPWPVILKTLNADGFYHNKTIALTAENGIRLSEEGRPMERFSLRTAMSPQMLASMDKIAPPTYDPNVKERILNAIHGDTFTKIRQGLVNRYERLAEYDRRVAKMIQKMGGVQQLADSRAESAALFSDLGAGMLETAMGAHDRVGGAPVFRNGVATISNFGGTVKGPIAIFKPLSDLNDPDAFRLYQTWAAVKRGKRLDVEGREQLIDKGDIAAVRAMEQANPNVVALFNAVQKDWIKYNNALVKFMQDTGVITPQMAAEYTKHGDYFPFYRLVDEDVAGPKMFTSIGNVRAPKKLKGGENPLGDFFENIVRNSQAAIQAGIKNIAAQRATEQALKLQEVTRLQHKASGPSIYRVLENGKEVYYQSHDPLFIEAIKALNMPDLPFIGLLAGPANLLRNLVTKDPAFMLANMMRDSLSAYVTSGVKMTPMVDTFRNFGKIIAGQSPELQTLYAAGVLGGYDYSRGAKVSGEEFQKRLREVSGTKTKFEKIATPVTSLWGALEKGTQASDAATRVEIYKRVLAQTGNEAEAYWQALEVMNFNRKGNSPVIRILTAAVPFLNARMQGLDILFRTAIMPIGATATEQAQSRMKTFWVRGMTIMALSSMYWLLTHDDDEYKKQEQETRDNFWLFPSLGIKIPIPFEVGTIFKTIPERIMARTFGQDTNKDFTDAMKRQFVGTFGFNLIPQALLPFYEVKTNHSFFTDRPIIGKGLEDVAPQFQIGPSTSRVAEMLGKSVGYSPMKVDHLIKGYTGTIGQYAADVFDMFYDMNSDAPKASKRFEQMPVIRRFALDPEARGTVTAYYGFKDSVDEIVRTSNLLERSMNFNEWGPYMQDNMKMLAAKDYLNDLEKTMKDYREMRLFIMSSSLSSDAKRDSLVAIGRMESALTRNIQTLKKTLD